MDYYIIHDILSYVNTDTKLIMNIVNKQYYVNIDMTNVYKTNSVRLIKYKFASGDLIINCETFEEVCKYCNIDIVRLMIDKGAEYWEYPATPQPNPTQRCSRINSSITHTAGMTKTVDLPRRDSWLKTNANSAQYNDK